MLPLRVGPPAPAAAAGAARARAVELPLVASVAVAVAPAAVGLSSWAGPAIIGVTAGLIWVVAGDREPAARRTAAVLAWALFVRACAAALLTVAAPVPLEQMLGPDSTGYLRIGRALAARDFHMPVHPTSLLGTNDVAPYLMFGAMTWMGADLFALQAVNCVFGAAAAGVAFSAARVVLPSYATALAVVVALDPSIVLLSSAGLLKDPSVMCASILVLWGLVRAFAGAASLTGWIGWTVAAIALVYLRVSRFYVAAYFELALAAAVLTVLVRRARRAEDRIWLVAGALLTVAAAELVPIALGWPSSAALLESQVRHVLGHPAMRYAARGLADRLWFLVGELSESKGASLQLVDIVRRLFGPFIWVAPDTWSARAMVYTGDYLLYPGTALWYGLLPYLALGIVVTPRLVREEPRQRLWLGAVTLFAVLYLLQYIVVNLSYRQRDAMLPVLLFVMAIGHVSSARFSWWKRAYLVYWLGLAMLAAVHLILRSVLTR